MCIRDSSYIERFFNKHIPQTLSAIFAPTLSIAVILPIALCILGPIGSILGEYISNALISLGNMGGLATILSMALIAALWEYIVMAGMHWLFITTIFMILAQDGVESVVAPSVLLAAFTVGGTVSYTHLDVYKRQVFKCRKRIQGFISRKKEKGFLSKSRFCQLELLEG